MSHTYQISPIRAHNAYHRLFISTTALALILAMAVGPHALAQQVILEDDTNHSDPATIDGSVDLQIGVNGTGALTIEDGGTLTNGLGHIGYGAGSQGTVNVKGDDGSGTASTWTNTGVLYVGYEGTGILNIEDGAKVSSAKSGSSGGNTTGGGFIGNETGSTGTVNVRGKGSSWTNDGDLVVGQAGNGILYIDGGGTVDNDSGYISADGSLTTASAATVSGEGSTWTNRGALYIAEYGKGTLTINDGGLVTSGNDGSASYIGHESDSVGSVEVSGRDSNNAASNWTSGGDLVVGQRGIGTLLIAHGGTVNSVDGYIGAESGSLVTPNAVTVTGDTSSWSNTGQLFVADSGVATLNILDGGLVTNTRGIVGNEAGSNGTVTVSGLGSAWTARSTLAIGNEGTGTLFVERGGMVSSADGTIGGTTGSGTTGSGTVIVSGTDGNGKASTWDTGNIYVGFNGSGTFTIADGGAVTSDAGGGGAATGYIGYGASGTGTVTVSSSTSDVSTWALTNDIQVGVEGTGTLNIQKGGRVQVGSDVTIARDNGSNGTLNLVGDAGGRGILETNSVIRGNGVAAILNLDGGILRAKSNHADFLNGFDSLDIGTEGAWFDTNTYDITIGTEFTGSSSFNTVGLGTLTLTGDSSAFRGTTTIDAGVLKLGNGGTTGSIAGDVVNNGTLSFDRSNNVVFGSLVSGSGNAVKNGAGVLELTADNSYLGTTDVNSGTLLVNGNQSAATGLTTVKNGATLGGSGTIGGDVTIADGATLAPGNSPGTLTINGNLSLSSGATLDYQFGEADVVGGALNDLVDVGGNLTLDGTLNVSESSGGNFGGGIYRVFNYGGTLTNNGLELGTMPSGSDVIVQTSIDHQVNLVNTVGLNLSFWDGDSGPKGDGTIDGGDGTWHRGGVDNNWTETTGTVNRAYQNGSFAIFAGTSGTVTIDNGGGAVKTSGMQFATDGYVVTGDALTLAGRQSTVRVGDGTAAGADYTATIDAELTGSSRLVKNDLGTLVLTGTNTYTGGTTINGGTVRIASDVNLGDTAGSLSLDGGTLHTTANIASGRSVRLTRAGTFLTDAGTTATLTGDVSGTGSLIKRGRGTLVITGDATQSGDTIVRAGTLQVGDGATSGSLQGNITNNGILAFDRSDDIVFDGRISGSGSLDQLGSGTTTMTGNNTYSGGTTISDGTLQIGNGGTSGSITGNVLNHGIIAFDRSETLNFRGKIRGTGGLEQRGTGTTMLTGISSYTGTTDVLAGTLAVNGSIANSSVLVHKGAALSGSGTVGTTTIASGGMIKPGDGVGTITVRGDYAQRDGATYEVGVDPKSSTSDRIIVKGEAVLDKGATIHVVNTTPYVVGARYTILTATGGLRGTFDLTGERDLTAFIRVFDDYDANNAYLRTKQTRTIQSVARTPNQIATATGIDSLALPAPVKTVVLNLPDEDAANYALDQLSGEIHASLKTAAIEDSHLVRDTVTDRIREAFCGVGTRARTDSTGNQQRSPTDCGAVPERLTTWGQAFGSWSHTDSDGNAAKLEHSSGGFIGGADALVFDTWRLGVLAGYGSSSMYVNDRNSNAKTNEYYLGVYGGTHWGNLGLRTGATYTWQNIDTKRSAKFPGFSENLSADYNAGLTQVFGDLGYQIDTGRVALEPFANLAYVSLDSDGFTERGGAAFLASPGGTTDTFFTTFGLRASRVVDLGGINLLARGSIGWRHALADTTPMSAHAFDGGSSFDIAGVPIAKSAAVINAGLDFDVSENATLGISYGGQFSTGAIDQSVRGKFSLNF